jgi:hypothetical protein
MLTVTLTLRNFLFFYKARVIIKSSVSVSFGFTWLKIADVQGSKREAVSVICEESAQRNHSRNLQAF